MRVYPYNKFYEKGELMLKKILLKIREVVFYDEEKANESYLSEARDIQDLEYRMKQLDSRRKNKTLYYYS